MFFFSKKQVYEKIIINLFSIENVIFTFCRWTSPSLKKGSELPPVPRIPIFRDFFPKIQLFAKKITKRKNIWLIICDKKGYIHFYVTFPQKNAYDPKKDFSTFSHKISIFFQKITKKKLFRTLLPIKKIVLIFAIWPPVRVKNGNDSKNWFFVISSATLVFFLRRKKKDAQILIYCHSCIFFKWREKNKRKKRANKFWFVFNKQLERAVSKDSWSCGAQNFLGLFRGNFQHISWQGSIRQQEFFFFENIYLCQ